MAQLSPFHLAVPVDDLAAARKFYGELLGCSEGRSDEHWIDYDLFGHQFVVHYRPKPEHPETVAFSSVDGHQVPVPHFGVVLGWDTWHELAEKLTSAGIQFAIEPYIRFKGLPGEQATMFFYDPAGNALEFKAFKDMGLLFAK
ncbi:MAG: VOC family protein [Bacteroidota bacterium]